MTDKIKSDKIKQCPKCFGVGRVQKYDIRVGGYWETCIDCNGNGYYIVRKEEQGDE